MHDVHVRFIIYSSKHLYVYSVVQMQTDLNTVTCSCEYAFLVSVVCLSSQETANINKNCYLQ